MKYVKISVWVIVVAVLAACSSLLPAPPIQELGTPTPDTSLDDTATAAPSVTFTPPPPTPSPTVTETQFPTITPIPTDTPIPSVTPLGAGPTPTPQYACELVEKYPDQWMPFKAHEPFEARWTLKNTGASSWQPVRVVLRYISGVKMYVGEEKQNLTTETPPGSLVLLIVDMRAPKGRGGEYATTWGLVEARTGNVFCAFTAKITTK